MDDFNEVMEMAFSTMTMEDLDESATVYAHRMNQVLKHRLFRKYGIESCSVDDAVFSLETVLTELQEQHAEMGEDLLFLQSLQ